MDPKALREQRAKLIADARAISDKAAAETRGLSPEETESQTKMLAEARGLVSQIQNAEELAREEADLRASLPESQRTEKRGEEKSETRAAYMKAFGNYLRDGYSMLSGEDQRTLRSGYVQFDGELRVQQTLTGAAGGFAVAPDTSFYGKVIEAEKFYGGILTAGVTTLNTATGADLPIATDDDTANLGIRVAESGSHAGGADVVLSQKILKAYLYSTRIVKVSWQLLQDSSFDFESYIARKFGQRLGRIKNNEFTLFNGTAGPTGVQFAAPVGRQGAVGTATSVTFDELKRAKHSVDPAYRAAAKWMFNDATALAISLLKDGNGRYLLTDSVREGEPQMLLGHPVVINNDMPDMAASAKSILFGDFSNYYVRNVQGIQIVRLSELYAESGQVGMMAFERSDAGLIDAGQGPIKAWQNSAT